MKQKFPGKLRTLGPKKTERQKGHGSPVGSGKRRRTRQGSQRPAAAGSTSCLMNRPRSRLVSPRSSFRNFSTNVWQLGGESTVRSTGMGKRVSEPRGEAVAQESLKVEDLGISESNRGSLKAKRLSGPLRGDKSYRRCERTRAWVTHSLFHLLLL